MRLGHMPKALVNGTFGIRVQVFSNFQYQNISHSVHHYETDSRAGWPWGMGRGNEWALVKQDKKHVPKQEEDAKE